MPERRSIDAIADPEASSRSTWPSSTTDASRASRDASLERPTASTSANPILRGVEVSPTGVITDARPGEDRAGVFGSPR